MKLLPDFPFPEPDLAKPIDMEKQKPTRVFADSNKDIWTILNKYDGIRGLMQTDSAGEVRVVSRNDKPLGGYNLTEIRTVWADLCDANDNLMDCIVDGEVYWDLDDFDRLSGMVRKTSAFSDDWEELYYVIFDCYWTDYPLLNWYERMDKLAAEIEACLSANPDILKHSKHPDRHQVFRWCMFPDGLLPVSRQFACTPDNSTLEALQKDCSGPVVSTPASYSASSPPPPPGTKGWDEWRLRKAEYIFEKKEYPDTKVLNCSLTFIQEILNRDSKPKVSTSTSTPKPKKPKKSGSCDIRETLEYALAEAESIKLEGIMIRQNNIPYNGGKSGSNLYKLKSFDDSEFLIVGFDEVMSEDHDPLGRPVWICDNGYGETFKSSAPGNHYSQAQQWRDRHDIVGKMLTVKYQELSKNNIPRFPKGVAIRDYE